MAESYRQLQMEELAAGTENVIRENYAKVDEIGRQEAEEERSWWKFW
jgi:outer membrane protein assembly factor BamD (BamD/ComL family)